MTTIITPTVPGVGNYRVSITRTGDATAAVDIQSWPNGIAIDSQPAASDQEINLDNITITGNVLTGNVVEPWGVPLKPVFTLTRSTVVPNSVTLVISNAAFWNQTISAALAPADDAALIAMLAAFAKPQTG